MSRYYECHITIEQLPNQSREHVRQAVERTGWKFSAIDGDPVLGNKVLCYATRHFANQMAPGDVSQRMNIVAEDLSTNQLKVVRQKVELVVYDTKWKNLDLAVSN